MAKNPNGKPQKRDNALYGATIFFLAACLAEVCIWVLSSFWLL